MAIPYYCLACHNKLTLVQVDEAHSRIQRIVYVYRPEAGYYDVAHSGPVESSQRNTVHCGLCGATLPPLEAEWFLMTFQKKLEAPTSGEPSPEEGQ